MSWLGGSLSSLTGQLSNLTKDILTEGTEEVSDHVTELRLAQKKLEELDTVCTSQKIEIDRLQLLIQEWEEKAEGSELQINKISKEYRTLLGQKESEIKNLKALQHEQQELKSSFVSQDAHPALMQMEDDDFQSIGYGGDEHDFGDNISMQRDINRLRGENQSLKEQCKHFKSLLDQQNNGHMSVDGNSGSNEALNNQIKELEQQLMYEKDQRQQEVSSLQDAHSHKMGTLRKKHKEEVAELKRQIQELDWGTDGWETQGSAGSDAAGLKHTVSKLQEEITSLQIERTNHLQQITDLNTLLEQHKSELSVTQAHNMHLENQLKVAKEEINRLGEDKEKKKELSENIAQLETVQKSLAQETSTMVEDMGDSESQQITSDIVDSLEKENILLREKNVSLQEQVSLLEKALQNTTNEKAAGARAATGESVPFGGDDLDFQSDTMSMNSDLSELSRKNLELDEEVINLKAQIKKYEADIGQFEELQADWQSEKESLEGVLVELRGQLKKKEHSLSVVEAQKGLIAIEKHENSRSDAASSSLEDIAEDVVELDSKVELLTEANARLEQERDSLVKEKMDLQRELQFYKPATEHHHTLDQAQNSGGDLGSPKPVGNLNKELQEKEAELQLLMTEKEDLKKNLSVLPELRQQLQLKETELHLMITEKEDLAKNLLELPELKLQLLEKEEQMEKLKSTLESSAANWENNGSTQQEDLVSELQRKLRGKNEEIVNLTLEKQELMTSLEELDNQHEEAMGHIITIKEQLAKNNDELKSKLKTAEIEIQNLNSEIDTVRNQQLVNQTDESSNSNELNHQIAELKEEISELRKDLDRSEANAAKLEIENAHLEKNVKEAKEKCLSSAAAINDLHMDKKELVEEIQKLKTDVRDKSLKLKQMRGKKEDLQKRLASSTEAGSEDLPAGYASDIKKTEEEYLQIQNDLEALEEKYLEEAEKCRVKEAELIELKGELTAAKKDCEDLKNENQKIHTDCESFSRQLHSLQDSKNEIKVECDELQTERENLRTQIEKLTEENKQLSEDYEGMKAECSRFETETKQTKDLLEDATDRLHNKCEECSELTINLEKLKHEHLSSIENLESLQSNFDAKLLSATGELALTKEELALTKEELASTVAELERIQSQYFAKEEELNQFMKSKEEIEEQLGNLQTEVKKLKEEKEQDNTSLQNYKAKLKEIEESNEKFQSEINKLQNELSEVNQKVNSQALHFETYIEELKSKGETDESNSHQQYDEVLEKSNKKDLEITEIKNELSKVEYKLSEANANVEKYQAMYESKTSEVDELNGMLQNLEADNKALSGQYSDSQTALQSLKDINTELKSEISRLREFEKQAKDFENERQKLNDRISEFQSKFNKTSSQGDSHQAEMNKLAQDLHVLQEKHKSLESEVERYKVVVQDQEASITELCEYRTEVEGSRQKLASQKHLIDQLNKSIKEKTEENAVLKEKLSQVNTNINGNSIQDKAKDDIELIEVNEQIEMVQTNNKLGMVKTNSVNDIDFVKPDISVEIDQLTEKLKEKDQVISEMQRNNASLLKMLDTKSKSSQGDTNLVEMHKLENEVRSLKTEKEQMIDVLNEKSRESSSLKAEVQRLMSVVSAEKAALQKLQQDNQELTRKSPDGEHISDMQKQVVQNLSRIIRDKDLEIESLTQKSETLLSVLQESSSEDSHINSLMQEKDSLTRQIAALQGEREQMIAYLNQKHQESVAYHGEVQRLTALINSDHEKTDKMKHEYDMLLPQFEEKKQTLVKVQNELIDYKQRYTDLEVKYGQLIQESSSDGTVAKAVFDSKVQELQKLQERYKELMDSVKEKELKIQSLHQNVSELEQNLRSAESEKNSFKKQVDGFTFQVHGLQTDQSEKHSEILQLNKQKNELTSELQLAKEMNNQLMLQLQDKEFELQSLQRSKTVLTPEQVGDGVGEKGQVESLIQENEAAQRQLKQLQHERDQAIIALNQAQEQKTQLLNDIDLLKQKEMKMNRELDRLRQHLIEIEDGYTKEALAAEEREKDLRIRLSSAEEMALASSSAVESANQQTSHQLDSLQQQLQFVSQQRDQAYLQISSLQEQNQMYSGSMANLQMVLEEFQEEKEKLVAQETEHLEKECSSLKTQLQKLQTDYQNTKEQLDEVSDGLEAAARLSEQLDRKEEALDALREEVQIRETALKAVEEDLHRYKSSNDDKVDKVVIKNLLLGYFTTPANKQREVLRAIGGILLFTSDDFEKIEGRGRGSGWVPGFLKFGGGTGGSTSPPTTPARRSTIGTTPTAARNVDNSFSEMFVRFLERESSPPPPTVRLPAEEMVRDVQKQKETQKPAYNPFTAPRQVAAPPTSSHALNSQKSQHLLMSSAMSMPQTIPTFAAPSESTRTPPGSGRNTPATTTSGAILKDVLNNR